MTQETSPEFLLKRVDKRITQQEYVHECKKCNETKEPFGNVRRCRCGSIEKEIMNLYYLKPRQMQLLYDVLHRLKIIRGPAGTGKTLLLLIHILLLLRSDTKYDIVICAPHPHHLRCYKFFKKNGVLVQIEDKFPTSHLIAKRGDSRLAPIVRIVELRSFYDSLPITNLDMPMHLFIDDLQAVLCYQVEKKVTNLKDFLFQFHNRATSDGTYCLITIDDLQRMNSYVKTVFEPQGWPIFKLDEVLRNSVPIIGVMNDQFSIQSRDLEKSDQYSLKNGHAVNGPCVDCYMLERPYSVKLSKAQKLEHLRMALEETFKIYGGLPIAVLVNKAIPYLSLEEVKDVLMECGKNPISIEEYITQEHDYEPVVVLDDVKNISSFEFPIVFDIAAFRNYNYPTYSRARAKLVLLRCHDMGHIRVVRKYYPDVNVILTSHSSLKSK